MKTENEKQKLEARKSKIKNRQQKIQNRTGTREKTLDSRLLC